MKLHDDIGQKSQLLKKLAKEKYGFDEVGIAKAQRLDEEEEHLRNWINKGYHGTMYYFPKRFEKRLDPKLLIRNAKSMIVFSYNYYPQEDQKENEDVPKIARYAYGNDYHQVIWDKLNGLQDDMSEIFGKFHGRGFVDSAPILEREWAKRAGIGWAGKNTLIINPKRGSYFFIAVMIVDLELAYDEPIKDYCGTCTRCIDACPTQAIDENGYILNATQCISYLTIESHNPIPDELRINMDNWAFGCDICQEVCPWNKFSSPNNEEQFSPSGEWLSWTKDKWADLDEDTFLDTFQKSPLLRPGLNKLKDNMKSND